MSEDHGTYSYHTFMFPFVWREAKKGKIKFKEFREGGILSKEHWILINRANFSNETGTFDEAKNEEYEVNYALY